MWAAIFHISSQSFFCPNPSQLTIQWNWGHCRKHFWLSFWNISFSDNMRLQQNVCQIVIISHNSAKYEKLNICIVCYITNHQNSWISLSSYFTTYKLTDVFLKTPIFGKKWNVIFIWLGSFVEFCKDWPTWNGLIFGEKESWPKMTWNWDL